MPRCDGNLNPWKFNQNAGLCFYLAEVACNVHSHQEYLRLQCYNIVHPLLCCPSGLEWKHCSYLLRHSKYSRYVSELAAGRGGCYLPAYVH